MRRLALPALAVLAAGCLCAAAFEERIVKTFPAAGMASISLKNPCGKVTMATHNRPEIWIEAMKRAERRADLSHLTVQFVQAGGQLRVDVSAGEPESSAGVDFSIRIPDGFPQADVAVYNGSLDAGGMYARLDATTVNGSIDFTGHCAEGKFSAENGSIRLKLDQESPGRIQAQSQNGGIVCRFHPHARFQVEAEAACGDIQNDFSLKSSRSGLLVRLSGQVRGGGERIVLATNNGDIEIGEL